MSVSNVVSRPVPDSSAFLKNLECPVIFKPLRDAVILIPCGHTISEVAAKNMYRGNGSGMVQTQGPCPLCRGKVTSYYPNYIIRSLVEEVLPAASSVVPNNEETNLEELPFPGLGAKFVLVEGNWDIFSGNTSIVRKLHFVSETERSLFHEMTVFGYRDGSIVIHIGFEKGSQTVPDYLLKCGIRDISSAEIFLGSYFSNQGSLKLLFGILEKHNEIPADKLPLIRDLVANGDWNFVTPLREGESLPTYYEVASYPLSMSPQINGIVAPYSVIRRGFLGFF